MSKTIEKIEAYKTKEIEKALSKVKLEYEESKDFYRDTGYDKYFKKMKHDMKNLVSKFFYMFADFNLPETAEVQGIQRLLEKYK